MPIVNKTWPVEKVFGLRSVLCLELMEVDVFDERDHSADIGGDDNGNSGNGVSTRLKDLRRLRVAGRRRWPSGYWFRRFKEGCELLDKVLAAVPKKRRQEFQKLIEEHKGRLGK